MNEIHHDDCRNFDKYLDGRTIDCIVTDPPFGEKIVMNSANSVEQSEVNVEIHGDADLQEALDLFKEVFTKAIPHMSDECEVYVFTSWKVADSWKRLLESFAPEVTLNMQLIWDKGYPGKGDLEACWGCGYEVIFYLKKGRRPVPYRRSGILGFDKVPSGQNIHPMEKPIDLMRTLIEFSTNPGDLVVDFFSGSGVTSEAAMSTGRDSLAFETDERWIPNSRKRLETVGFNF